MIKWIFIALTIFLSVSCAKKDQASDVKEQTIKEANDLASEAKKKFVPLCSVEKLKDDQSDYPVHTTVKKDLNGDGLEDLFFLYGEEDFFTTCINLQKKDGSFVTVQADENSYNSVFEFAKYKGLVLLVKGKDELDCGVIEGSLPPISEKTMKKIDMQYKKWTKNTSEFNIDKDTSLYPLALFSLNKFYSFKGLSKLDVTDKMKEYKSFKKGILKDILKEQDITKICKESLENLLKKL